MARDAMYPRLFKEAYAKASSLTHEERETTYDRVKNKCGADDPTTSNLIEFTARAGISADGDSLPTRSGKRGSDPLAWRNGLQTGIIRPWLWELLASATSLLGVAAITILLICYDGHPQPDWPSWLNLNTILAMFTTLIAASFLLVATSCISQAKWIHYRVRTRPLKHFLMFDEASRGPLGSLRVLWASHGNLIIVLGAVLTISAIGIGPTVQQMIKIQSHQVDTAFVATLPRAQSYLKSDWTGIPIGGMMGSVYSGMYVGSDEPLGISLDVLPNCPSGNCTFPPLQSLAVCSACDDLSSQLTKECINGTFQYVNQTQPKSEQLYCKLSLPNGLSVNITKDPELATISTSGYLPVVGDTRYGNSLLNYTKIRGPYYEPSLDGPNGSLNYDFIADTTAQQCYLYWCVNTYQSYVLNGRTIENISSSWYSNTTTWLSTDPDDRYSLGSTSYLVLKPDPISPDYMVTMFVMDSLSSWLANLVTLSNSLAYSAKGGVATRGPSVFSNASSGALDRINIFHGFDDETIFANIARSMTRHVRSVNLQEQIAPDPMQFLSVPNTTGVGPATGTEQVEYIFISVRWGWLTLSIVLVGVCITVLMLTILDAKRHHIEAWKSSPLPILLQGLGRETVVETGGMRSMAEMEKVAEGVHMKFCSQQAKLSVDKPSTK